MEKDYAANSKKSKEKSEEVPKKLESVVTGPVIQKPPSVGHKFKTIFFGGDFKSSATHVVANVFWPALRQLAFEIVVEGTRGVLFGESGYRGRTQQQPMNYGSRFQYNTPSQLPRPDPRVLGPTMTRIPDQRPFQPRPQVNRREMNQIILYSRQEAENVLERMTDVFDQYNVVSVADLFEILGLETSPIDNKWGWNYIHNTEIRQVKEGYLLDLPPVEVI